MVIHRCASRLYHEHIRAPAVLLNLNIALAVGEGFDLRHSQVQTQIPAYFLGQSRIGVAAEDLDSFPIHRAYRLWGGHDFSLVCDRSRFHHSARNLARLTSVIGKTRSFPND